MRTPGDTALHAEALRQNVQKPQVRRTLAYLSNVAEEDMAEGDTVTRVASRRPSRTL